MYAIIFDNNAGKRIQIKVDYYSPKNETYFILSSDEQGTKFLNTSRYDLKKLSTSFDKTIQTVELWDIEEMN